MKPLQGKLKSYGQNVLLWVSLYRVVQLNFTPEIDVHVFYMLFDRYLSMLNMISPKHHMEYDIGWPTEMERG